MDLRHVTFAAGCFWHVEEAFRTAPGVIATEVGYAGGPAGVAADPTPCRRDTGHVEAARVTYDPSVTSLDQLLTIFWERHDPAARHRIEGGAGYRYRSAVYLDDARDLGTIERSIAAQRAARPGTEVTTTVEVGAPYQRAADEQQQRLHRRAERLACST